MLHNYKNEKYDLIKTYTSNGYHCCEHCNRTIKNIAVIQDSFYNQFSVGLDCAKTLSFKKYGTIEKLEATEKSLKKINAFCNFAEKKMKHSYYNKIHETWHIVDYIPTEENFNYGHFKNEKFLTRNDFNLIPQEIRDLVKSKELLNLNYTF